MTEEMFLYFNREEAKILLSMVNFFKKFNIQEEKNAELNGIIKKLSVNVSSLDTEDFIDNQEKFKEDYLDQTYSELITYFKQAKEGITISIDEIIRYANPAFIKLLEYDSLDRILHLGFNNLISKQDYQKIKNYYENRLKGLAVPNIYEIELIRANGAKILIDCVNYCMPFQGRNLIVTFYISLKNLKNLEAKLRKSEEISRNILDNSSFLIYQFNLKTNLFDYISPSSIRMLGYSPEGLTSLEFKKILDLIHPEDKERFQKYFKNIIKQEAEKELNLALEYRFKHKKLGFRWFNSHHSIIFDDKHNPISIVGNVRDITKMHRIEEELSRINKELTEKLAENSIELKETLENYKNLIDTTNTGYLVIDEKGLVLYANPEYVHISGHRLLKDILGRSMIEWTADYQKDEITQKLMNCTTQESLGTFNVDYKDKDGKISTIEMHTNIYKTEEGDRVICICHDITKFKIAEQKLKESEILYRTTVNGLHDNLHVINQDLELVLINNSLKQSIKNLNLDTSLIGKTIKEVFPFLSNKVLDEYRSVFNNKSLLITVENTFIDKKQFTTETRKIPIFDDEENVIQIITIIRDITEAKQSEKKLKESEEKWRAITNYTPDHIAVLDKDAKFLFINYTVPDLTVDEVIGRSLYDFVQKEYLEQQRNIFNGVLNTGKVHHFETGYVDKDGNQYYFDVSSGPLWKDGKVIGIINRSTDITVRKETERKLKESEEKYRQLFDTMLEGFAYCKIITDENNVPINFRYLEVNDAFEKLTGLKKEETVGKRVTEVIPGIEDSEPNLFEIYGKVALTGENTNFEIFFEPLKIWLSISVHSPEKYYFVAIFENITERKKIEVELNNIKWLLNKRKDSLKPQLPIYGDLSEINTSREILDSVGKEMLTEIARDYLDLLNTSAAIYEKNGDYALGIFSSNWCQFLDESSRNICNTNDNKEALNCGKWHCHESCWTETSKISIETGKPYDKECEGGLHIYAIPVWVEGDVVGSINVGYGDPPKDIKKLTEISERYEVRLEKLLEHANSYKTRPQFIIDIAKKRLQTSAMVIGAMIERRRIKQKLIETQEQLIRHEKLATIGKLAGSIGHELRNPLGVISNSIYYLNLKLKDIDVDEKVKKHLRIMEEGVRTSNSIITNMLDFSKMRNPIFEAVEINAILEECLDFISLPMNVILEKHISAEIPRLLLDPFQIKLAIRNIVLNAIQAMSKGGKLKIKSFSSGNIVKLVFKDTGIGITKENLPKIFEPLFSTKVKGIGLGLSMVKDIIEKHKGFVKVDSEVDVGSTFTIFLPLIRREQN